MNSRIMVVDDESDFLDSVRRGLITAGYKDVTLIADPLNAAERVEKGEIFDIALLDITMPGLNGMDLLEKVKSSSPATECIMVTAINEVNVAVECMQKGAHDYLVKPFLVEDLVLRIRRALRERRLMEILVLKSAPREPVLDNAEAFKEITTVSLPVLKLLREAELHAESDVPVLITGESGTGKELLARAIHKASHRAKFSFTAINMASMAETLFDAEFFGHTKGAFTGADKERPGYLEQANHGTLFLDEISSLPLGLQGKLLRVLQEGEFIKVGSSRTQRIDIRFIAATNQDLERLMAKGSFRKDLFYRLRGAWLHLPPLRERREDIPVLIARFLDEIGGDGPRRTVEREAMERLKVYDYQGNIRELKSIIQVSANLARKGPISVESLPPYLLMKSKPVGTSSENGAPVPLSLEEMEKAHILRIYHSTDQNKSQTAKLLGIGLSTLRRKLESYGLE